MNVASAQSEPLEWTEELELHWIQKFNEIPEGETTFFYFAELYCEMKRPLPARISAPWIKGFEASRSFGKDKIEYNWNLFHALVRFQVLEALPVFARILTALNVDGRERGAAARALGEILEVYSEAQWPKIAGTETPLDGTKKYADLLAANLGEGDDYFFVRSQASRSLMRIGRAEHLHALAKVTHYEFGYMEKLNAAHAIGHICQREDAVRMIGEKSVRELCQEIKSDVRSTGSVDALRKAVQNMKQMIDGEACIHEKESISSLSSCPLD